MPGRHKSSGAPESNIVGISALAMRREGIPPPRRDIQIPPSAVSNVKKEQSQSYGRDDEEEDTVFPVFGPGKGGNTHKHSTTQSYTLGPAKGYQIPRERRNVPASPLRSLQKPDYLAAASNSDAPTAGAFPRPDRDGLCDTNPRHCDSVNLSPLRESHSPAKSIDLSIPKLAIVLQEESFTEIEICFGV
ncbi:hypothetical protein B0H13DRAFT_368851 [Mycena leptocephala]|nr:hypothetical protein B0H13DRAFT_368851 [Mycena leptocephala]